MIRIESGPWAAMVAHARQIYPNECCGAMLGHLDDGSKVVRIAMPLENAFTGAQRTRYELRPEDLLPQIGVLRSQRGQHFANGGAGGADGVLLAGELP